MKVSVLLPFYNEEAQIPITLKVVTDVLNELSFAYELVLVDDGSKDGTWAALEAASQSYDGVKAIHFSLNFGKEAAICAGLDYVSGDCTILMDGDLQHPPSYIPEMIRLWAAEGYEVVEGVKAERQTESVFSRWAANTFYKFFVSWADSICRTPLTLTLDKSRSCLAQSHRTHHFFRGLSAWLGLNAPLSSLKSASAQLVEVNGVCAI